MKPQPPQKKEFFHLLNLAVRKDEKANQRTQTKKNTCGCSDKRTHQDKIEDIGGKPKHKCL